MASRLTWEEGIFVGGSSGLITHVALNVARRINDPDALMVTFLCDTGERYLSKLYSDEWMRENQLLDSDKGTIAQVMNRKPGEGPTMVSTAPGAPVRQALRLMSLHDISQLPVMDGAVCVGSVMESSLAAKALENPKLLDATVSDVMDAPFPIIDVHTPADNVAKLLSKSNPAVLIQAHGVIQGIVTRGDLLQYLMSR